jgi:hypothetical protein
MNYYILTDEVFDELDKDLIDFALQSIDETEWTVTTTEVVDNEILSFENTLQLSLYTIEEGSFWTGDNTGIEVWELEEIKYLKGI